VAKARPIPGQRPDTRFGDAAAAAIEVRSAEVFEHAAGVLDMGDIERVHNMRVATRRLRAALEVFAACFPRKRHAALLHEVKALADALGERRDPDVAIEELEAIAGALGEAERPGIAGLIEEERAEQRRGNRVLAAMLARVHDNQLERRLLELAASAKAPAPPRQDGPLWERVP
jgi:CHAD domain-containing protein